MRLRVKSLKGPLSASQRPRRASQEGVICESDFVNRRHAAAQGGKPPYFVMGSKTASQRPQVASQMAKSAKSCESENGVFCKMLKTKDLPEMRAKAYRFGRYRLLSPFRSRLYVCTKQAQTTMGEIYMYILRIYYISPRVKVSPKGENMGRINSCKKGKVGELEFVDFLKAFGLTARRGQQFSGSNVNPDGTPSEDVVCEELSHLLFEIKRVEALSLYKAMDQATRDAKISGNTPTVMHRRNRKPWLAILYAEDFIKMQMELLTLKGDRDKEVSRLVSEVLGMRDADVAQGEENIRALPENPEDLY